MLRKKFLEHLNLHLFFLFVVHVALQSMHVTVSSHLCSLSLFIVVYQGFGPMTLVNHYQHVHILLFMCCFLCSPFLCVSCMHNLDTLNPLLFVNQFSSVYVAFGMNSFF